MSLYNLKTDGDHYRITKFTNDLEVESSYLCSETECECPAGHRPSCRHRQMLPILLANDMLDRGKFYDFDTQQFYQTHSAETSDFEASADAIEHTPDPEAEVIAKAVTEGLGVIEVTEEGEVRNITEEFFDLPTVDNVPVNEVEEIIPQIAHDAPHPTFGHVKRRV